MLGNLNSGGNAAFSNLNQGLAGCNSGGNSGLNGPGSHTPGSNSGLSGSPTVQRSLSVGAESLAFAGTGSMGFPASPLSFSSSNLNLTGTIGLVVNSLNRHGSATRLDQQDRQQLQQHQQMAVSNPQYSQDSQQLAQRQQQLEQQQHGQQIGLPHLRSQQVFGIGMQQQMQGLASVKLEQQQVQPMQALASVKMEPQMDSPLRQQLQQPVQGLTSVKLEQVDASVCQRLQHQQTQALQGVGPVKLDSRQHDQPLHRQLSVPKMEVKSEVDLPSPMGQQSLRTSHLQRQEVLQLHRQQSQQIQAQMNLLQQQKLLHQHRSQLQQQQHLRQQLQGPPKQLVFEPGICARRLMQYVFNQRQRPQDNNIHFWRRFVGEFFAHGAKKRWCVSQYGNSGRQPTGVFPQDVWHCEICGSRPGRGFETTVEVLPRLCKIKYDSGILDELLFVDIPNEYRLSSGLMVLEYGKAIQESIFDQLRVVREGQLRIIFSPELKILLWEFCARGHEELLPRRLLVPQVTQLAAIAQKYQNSIGQNQNGASSVSVQDLQTNCQLFVGAARQLTRTLEAPTVNDLGYTKRYVRCLQISEVVNSMKDLIDFSRENRIGPIASLLNFPRRTASLEGLSGEALQQQEQLGPQTLPSEQNMGQAGPTITSANNSSLTGSINSVAHNTNSIGSFPTLLHQNSLTSLQSTLQNNCSSSMAAHVNTSSSGLAFNTLTSSQRAYFSLQNCHPSMTGGGQPSPASMFSHSAQQNSLSSAVNLLQQSSGQHESSNVAHQLQDLMMSSQSKSGAVHHQPQLLAGGANIKMNASLNEGMVSGAGNLTLNANGLGSSGNVNESLVGGERAEIGSAVSDSDNGNLGGLSSSFSDGLMNQNFLSGNGNNMMSLGSSLSVNSAHNLIANGAMHRSSVIAEEQSLAIQDPSQSFLHDFGSNDILSSLGNTGFNSLGFSWKSP